MRESVGGTSLGDYSESIRYQVSEGRGVRRRYLNATPLVTKDLPVYEILGDLNANDSWVITRVYSSISQRGMMESRERHGRRWWSRRILMVVRCSGD